MPKVRFEFAALHYLNQWLAHDRKYCDGLADKNEAKRLVALKQAAGFYRVSRNLPELHDTMRGLPRYKPLLDVLDAVTPAAFQGNNLTHAIIKVQNQISTRYGERKFLSLTTKFLWLKIRSPIVIYDSRARSALRARPGDIDDYYSKWRKEFDNHKREIRAACKSLRSVTEYSLEPEEATPHFVEELSSHQWFQERVLDSYLWHHGG